MTDPLIDAIGRAVEALPAGALDTLEASLHSGGGDAAVVAAVPRNMEIGLLVEGGEIPARVDQHLRALTRDGELTLIRP